MINESGDERQIARAKAVLLWVEGLRGVRRPGTIALSSERTLGKVRWRHSEKPFGFIATEHGLDVFFSRSNMRSPSDFDLLRPGLGVSFVMAVSEQGRKALDVGIE